MATEWEAAFELGRSLTEEDADALEAAIGVRPDEPGIRVVLVGFYFRRTSHVTERALEHVSWLVHNHPDLDGLSALPVWAFDPDEKRAMARLWRHATEQHPDDAAMLVRAHKTGFFDPNDAESLIQHGLRLAPDDVYWPIALGQSRRKAAREAATEAARMQLLREASAAYARGAELDTIPRDRVFWLNNAAKLAFAGGDGEGARTSATTALAELRDDMGRDFVMHDANIILGHVALAANDVAAACRHLAAAAFHTPQPDEDLALALLARGERQAVVAYMSAFRTLGDHDFLQLEAALRANSR